MENYIITSNYEYKIKAKDKTDAIDKWVMNVEDELASENRTLADEFVDSVEVETEQEKLYKGFYLTTVTRADIIAEGLATETEALKISDEKMERIASKMADAYLDNGYHTDLEIIIGNEL